MPWSSAAKRQGRPRPPAGSLLKGSVMSGSPIPLTEEIHFKSLFWIPSYIIKGNYMPELQVLGFIGGTKSV